MKRLFAAILSVALACASPASAQQVVIDDSFNWTTFDWSGNGSTLVVWRAVIIEGKIAVCGAYAARGGRKYANLSGQAIRDMRVDSQSGAFQRNLSFFSRLSSRNYGTRLVGEVSNCRVSTVNGGPADLDQFKLGFTPQRYRF